MLRILLLIVLLPVAFGVLVGGVVGLWRLVADAIRPHPTPPSPEHRRWQKEYEQRRVEELLDKHGL